MKASELTGALLDYWVARAEGIPSADLTMQSGFLEHVTPARIDPGFVNVAARCYSTDWTQGGPIIEREMITVTPQAYDVGPATSSGWVALVLPYGLIDDHNGRRSAPRFFDKSYLVAAMRAYVASKFGDEVEDLTDHPA